MESQKILIKQDIDVFTVRRIARKMSLELGFDLVETTAIETAVAELSSNVLRHAREGSITLRPLDSRKAGLEVRCEDRGPGIANAEAVLRGTASSGKGLGIGLGGVKRLMDELEIESQLGQRTLIIARKWLPKRREARDRESGGRGHLDADSLSSTSPSPLLKQSWHLPYPTWSIQVTAASRPAPGETANGDGWLVKNLEDRLLIALVDGLGHGEASNLAAQRAIASIERHNQERLAVIMQRCHEDLRETRGAAVALALLEASSGTVTYAGIGNTGVRIAGQNSARPISLSGIVGYNMRRVREDTFLISTGDFIVMYTDGISERFDLQALPYQTSDLEALTESIIIEYGRENDDATIIAIRLTRDRFRK